LAIALLTYSQNVGYDGLVTVLNVDVGTTGNTTISSGTYKPDVGQWWTCGGNWTKDGGTVQSYAYNLEMTGDGTVLKSTANAFISVKMSGNVSTDYTGSLAFKNLEVVAGKTFSASAGDEIYMNWGVGGYTLTNNGTIAGDGSFRILFESADYSTDLGVINCPVELSLYPTSGASHSLTLTANAVLGSTLNVNSGSATYTMTLDTAGYNVSCTDLTLGDRGIVNQSSGGVVACTSYTQSGTDSLFTQGAEVTCNGDCDQSDGGLAGDSASDFIVSGDFTRTGGTVSNLILKMTGDGKTITSLGADNYKGLKIFNNVSTVAGVIQFTANLEVDTGKIFAINATGTVRVYYYAGNTYLNNGIINGGVLQIYLYDANQTITFGTVNANIQIYAHSAATADRVLTPGANTTLGSTLTVQSLHATYTTTLDTDGYNLSCTGKVTSGVRGIIDFGEGEHQFGDSFDYSAGAIIAGTSLLIMTGEDKTITGNGSDKLWDLLVAHNAYCTLGADLTVENKLMHNDRFFISDYMPAGSRVRDESLALSLDMETLSAGDMKDFSANGNDGAITGTTVVGGRRGMARRFNGTTDIIEMGGPVLVPDNVTISVWVYVMGDGSSTRNGITEYINGFLTNKLEIANADDKIRATFQYTVEDLELASNNAITRNRWCHVVFRVSVNTGNIFIDNVLDANTDTKTGVMVLGGTHTVLGCSQPWAGNRNFNGIIDEFQVWARPLSDAEIEYLYFDALGGIDKAGYALEYDANQHVHAAMKMDDVIDMDVHSLVGIAEQDLLRDVLAAAANAVHAAIAGTGASQDIVAGIINPDTPRNISLTTTNNAAPSGDVVIEGVDAQGDATTDTITIVAGGLAYGVVAFSTVTRITIPAGVGGADTVTVGTSDKVGLKNPIYSSLDVFKIKKNNADMTIPTVDPDYATVDLDAIGGGDDYTIWYRSV